MKTKTKILISVMVIVIVALLGTCVYFYHTISTVANAKNICEGVHIDGVDVGGMTEQEAVKAVTDYEEGLSDKEVTISYEEHKDSLKLKELGYSYEDVKAAVSEAYEIGKKGSMWQRYKAIKAGAGKGTDLALEKKIDQEAFSAYVDENAEHFVKVAANATLKRENGAFIVTDEQNGMEVPVESNVESLNQYLNGEWKQDDFTYELQADVAEPEYTREDLEKVKDVLGTYTTSFATSSSSRITNLRNACSKINGTMVYPGETFSIMDLIAPLNADNGYLKAGSYSAGELVESYGGGVCQVATTLYNAVLLAELDVTERYNHQMTVSYVDLSFDAAVSDSGNQDFKFVNVYDIPLYVEGYIDGYTITFTIYGEETRAENRRIEYYSERLATIQPGKDIVTKDKNMEEGKEKVTQSSHTGYRAKLWKRVYIDGVEQSNTEVNSSYYAPSARRVTVGTKKKEEDDKDKDKDDNKKPPKTTQSPKTTQKPATTEAPVATEAPVVTEAPPAATEAPAEGQ